MIKYTTIQKILKSERFAVNFLIIGMFLSLISIVIISICSKISPACPTVENLRNFVTYYDFSIKIMAVTLTIFGILIVYHTYFQTKSQFLILNSASLKTEIKPELRPFKNDERIVKLFILFEVQNTGNTPAENFEIQINTTTDQAELSIPQPDNVPKAIFPNHSYVYLMEIGKTYHECIEIMKVEPTFTISVIIKYLTLDNTKFNVYEKYEYKYGKLISLIDSDVKITKNEKL